MLTVFDHWLRERFIYKTHIYTMRLPEKLPRGIKVRELPASPSRRYRYRAVSSSNKKTDQLVRALNEGGMMFSTQIVESKGPLKGIIAPKGQSVLLSVFWLLSMLGLTLASLKLFDKLKSDEVFVANFKDAVSIFLEPE